MQSMTKVNTRIYITSDIEQVQILLTLILTNVLNLID